MTSAPIASSKTIHVDFDEAAERARLTSTFKGKNLTLHLALLANFVEARWADAALIREEMPLDVREQVNAQISLLLSDFVTAVRTARQSTPVPVMLQQSDLARTLGGWSAPAAPMIPVFSVRGKSVSFADAVHNTELAAALVL